MTNFLSIGSGAGGGGYVGFNYSHPYVVFFGGRPLCGGVVSEEDEGDEKVDDEGVDEAPRDGRSAFNRRALLAALPDEDAAQPVARVALEVFSDKDLSLSVEGPFEATEMDMDAAFRAISIETPAVYPSSHAAVKIELLPEGEESEDDDASVDFDDQDDALADVPSDKESLLKTPEAGDRDDMEDVVARVRERHEEVLKTGHANVVRPLHRIALEVFSPDDLLFAPDGSVGDHDHVADMMDAAFSAISPELYPRPKVALLDLQEENECDLSGVSELYRAPEAIVLKAAQYKLKAKIAKIAKVVGKILFIAGLIATAVMLGSPWLLMGLGLAFVGGAVAVAWIKGVTASTASISQGFGNAAQWAASSIAIKTAAVACGVISVVGAVLWAGGSILEQRYLNKLSQLEILYPDQNLGKSL